MAMTLATLLFAAFVSNVVLGATTGSPLLSDVQEMMLLFAASIAFVAAILRREARAKTETEQEN